MLTKYGNCSLCARMCGKNRLEGETGFCRMTSDIRIAKSMLHMWEEPIISGERGSGAIFFVGCSLGCIYCQNRDISRGDGGRVYGIDELSRMMLELESQGADNINLVTPTHYAPSIAEAVKGARALGLSIPIVYNTSSYDTVETIADLCDTVDVFLADMKYYKADRAMRYSSAPDYHEVASRAIDEMVRLRPMPILKGGLMRRGVIVRLLLLPGMLAEAKLCLRELYSKYGENIYYSLMSQYTPSEGLPPPLNRRVTNSEYSELVDYAVKLGIENCFIQDRSSAISDFTPDFK